MKLSIILVVIASALAMATPIRLAEREFGKERYLSHFNILHRDNEFTDLLLQTFAVVYIIKVSQTNTTVTVG